MALNVQTNITSLTAQRDLRLTRNKNEEAINNLSSGKRVNTAKDDPCNLEISHKFTSQINCLQRGNRNASEGQAVADEAESSLAEDFTILQRIRQLAIQSANGTNTSEDRLTMQCEVSKLCSEITRIACKTTYGGSQLLNGKSNGIIDDAGKLTLQVGANANTTLEVNLDVSFTMSSLQNHLGGVSDGQGYNATDKAFDISTQSSAQMVLGSIDSYIEYVDSKKSELGAVSNRIDSSIRNQQQMHEDESSSRSQMVDADYATESSKMIESDIMTNATSQMLMQANARPGLVASLLS